MTPNPPASAAAVSVVIATRDRRDSLLATLDRLTALSDRPDVIVVDNGSTDGTADAVATAFPDVRLVALGRNHGAVARNHGVALATTRCVAFADDDSWWADGSLARADALFEAHPRLAVIQGRIVIEPDGRIDPVCCEMATDRLGDDEPPGPSILGFVACGAIVRRSAFLAAGGFDDVLFFFGEESLLAQDLAAAGWALSYVADVVAHHQPGRATGDRTGRERRRRRNEVLAAIMRRPAPVAARLLARLAVDAACDPDARAASREVVQRAAVARRRRHMLPGAVEARLHVLEHPALRIAPPLRARS